MEPPRRSLDVHPLGQLEAADRRRCDCPQVAALAAQRIFEQQRFRIEHLLLDLLQAQRLRLRQRGIARALATDLRPHLLILRQRGIQLLFCHRGSILGMLPAQHARQSIRVGIQTLLNDPLALQQRGVDALPDIGVRFGQHLQQAARAGPLAGHQGLPGSMHPHQQVDVEFVIVVIRGQVAGAQIRAGDLRPQRFHDNQRGLHPGEGFRQIAAVALDACQRQQVRGLSFGVADCAPDGESLRQRLQGFLRATHGPLDLADIA